MMAKVIDICAQIRRRLMAYSETAVFQLNTSSKVHVANMHMAVSLAELGVASQRPISALEEFWFEGGVVLAREFDNPEWEDLHALYTALVEQVKEKNYFR